MKPRQGTAGTSSSPDFRVLAAAWILLTACLASPSKPVLAEPTGASIGVVTSEGTPRAPVPLHDATPVSPAAGCPHSPAEAGNAVVNGDFEDGDAGWTWESSGTGASWREHVLFGSAPGIPVLEGSMAASLGGFEGSVDRIRQQVSIPVQAVLSFWWRIEKPRPSSQLTVSLTDRADSLHQVLAFHRETEAAETWIRDCIDLSSFGGEEYFLEFVVWNDNYTMTAFVIDEVVLAGNPR